METTKHTKTIKSAKHSRHLHPKALWVGLGLALVLGGLGLNAWLHFSTHEETDDATLAGDLHPISARVNGTIVEVLVKENQQVHAGQVLAILDPRDYEVKLQKAEAALAVARQEAKVGFSNVLLAKGKSLAVLTEAKGILGSASSAIDSAKAAVQETSAGVAMAQRQLAQEEAILKTALADYQRYQSVDPKAISQQQLDSSRNTYEVALEKRNAMAEQLNQAKARRLQAIKQVNASQGQFLQSQGTWQDAKSSKLQVLAQKNQHEAALSQVKQAEAELAQAKLEYSYTTLKAPVSGKVSHKTLEIGQQIQAGQPLMAIVENTVWAMANFKETQIGRIKPGQPVELKVDAFPGHVFEGTVDSIAPGSGALFSLLPPDNATGNFTKIVQRVPVKIIFLPKSLKEYEGRLLPGMSTLVSIRVR